MNQLTFVDKIQVLFNLLFSSPIIIGIFAFSMILMILLFFYSKLNKKIMKYSFVTLYILIIGFAVVRYGSYFLTSIDSFITLFMANIYFPILPVYIFIMLVSFIIMIVTLSSKSEHKIVKIINTVFFSLIQMLFALFIYIVESSKIDLSSNNNLYSNEQTLTLLELGMGLFFVWIVILLIVLYLKKADKIFRVKNSDNTDDFDDYINDYNEPGVVNSSVSSSAVVNISESSNNLSAQELFNSFNYVDSNSNSLNKIDNSSVNSTNVQSSVYDNAEIVDFSIFSSDFNDKSSNNSNSSISNFNNDLERKNDDVEIVDFDL